MPKTLLHFVHPALEKSQVNRRLLPIAHQLDDVAVNDLYELYPDFHIDAKREQALMESHERIVFQFPFYWYSGPALLKEWFDIVLEYGWAYGSLGSALVGKRASFVVTTGGPADSYTAKGHNGSTMSELLRPMFATLKLCGMILEEPLYIHNALHLDSQGQSDCTAKYRRWLNAE
ncbi:MAG: NAD(P)H-dependent oxidoreductase [Verrucomicrobiota bacterium]